MSGKDSSSRARFGEIAVEEGFLSRTEVDQALLRQRDWRQSHGMNVYLGQVLLRQGRLTHPQIFEILRRQLAAWGERLSQDRPFASSERTIGKYRIIRKVAAGAMAIVYEAEDPDLHRRVALKVLRRSELDPEGLTRFRQEGILAARLRHPGIVTVHEIGVATDDDESIPFISMDFIEGETLTQHMVNLSLEQSLRILEQVALAVGFAHGRGIVHRDLKPANILVTKDGVPIVTDFGLAIETGAPRMTMPGILIGTPAYMAPEQVEGKSPDARTDVWALGVILYEMLTGALPFQGGTFSDMYSKILDQEPLPARLFGRRIPVHLEAICQKALEKLPERRYANAGEMGEDLRRFRNGEATRARLAGVFHRVIRGIRRWRPALIGILAGMLLTAVASRALAYHQEGRSFEKARCEARIAFQEGDWQSALFKAETALGIRSDDGLSQMASACRNRIREEKERASGEDGEGGIRTHGPLTRSRAFEARPINRSGTSPWRK